MKGINAQLVGDASRALLHFQAAAAKEPSAALMAAMILFGSNNYLAARMLEAVLRGESVFPTEMMLKYSFDATIQLQVTTATRAEVSLGALFAILALTELYQAAGDTSAAIGLLEEAEELADEPALTLSLCELYTQVGFWDGVIERAARVKTQDNVTLETVVLYSRALLAKGVADGAIMILTEALRKKSGLDTGLLLAARYWRARSYETVGKRTQARRDFERVFAEDPGFEDTAVRLAALART